MSNAILIADNAKNIGQVNTAKLTPSRRTQKPNDIAKNAQPTARILGRQGCFMPTRRQLRGWLIAMSAVPNQTMNTAHANHIVGAAAVI